MLNKLLFITLLLLVFGSQAQQNFDSDASARIAEALKNIRLTTQPNFAPQDSKTNIEEFVKGFVNGVGSSAIFSVIKPCITNDEQILKDLAQAVTDLRGPTPEDVKKGLRLLADAAKIVPVAASYCAATGFDIKRVIHMIQAFENPASFIFIAGRNILINHVEVIKEVKAIIEAHDTKNYNALGFWIGRAMTTVIIGQSAPVQVKDNKADLENFAKGFLEGVGSASSFDSLKACIADDELIASDIQKGFQLIKTKTPENVKQGVKLLGDAANIIPSAAQLCKAASADIEALDKLIKTFTSPRAFFYYVGKSLLINHVEVINEVEGAVNSYEDKNMTGTGYWIGKTMDTIFLGGKTVAIPGSKADVLNFVQGFFDGVGSAPVFSVVKPCINDTETVLKDLAHAIVDLRSKDPIVVKRGLKLLGNAAKIVPVAAQYCLATGFDVERVIKMIQTFSNPASFIFIAGRNILIDHVEIFHEIEAAIHSYDDKNFNTLGYWVGRAMVSVILGGSPATGNFQLADPKTDMLMFAKGFLQGVGSAPVFDELKACIADDKTVAADLKNGIALIKTKTPENVKKGVQLIGQAAQILPAAAQVCRVADAKIQKLMHLIKTFTTPQAFFYFVGKSLLINHVEVIREVEGAVNAYEDKNMTGTGFFVGSAMATIFLKNNHEELIDTKSDVVNFVQGFLVGAGSAPAFNDIKACIQDDQVIVNEVKTGIELIKTKNPEKVKEGVQLIGKAAQVIPTAAQMCQATSADVQKLVKFIKSFTNPKSFIYYVGKSLIINHVEVISEVNQAVNAYYSQNFTGIGFWVGKAMDSIFLGDKRTLSEDLVNHLNQKSGWKAALPEKFKGMTIEDIKRQFLGANMIDLNEIHNLTVMDYEGLGGDIPASFDASKQWPGCVHPIRDQQKCGSCWAFAASESLSDRFCIASKGAVDVVLSPQYLLSCNNVLNHGCNGGVPLFSWWFIAKQGLVTDDCLPYQSGTGHNPVSCKDVTKCADGSAIKNYHSKAGSTVMLKNPTSIQQNLMQYGPVEAAFSVYEDFLHYNGGIYKHTSGSMLGGHAVKIVGWGNEDGTNYWIVANSWNTTWGEKGFFRIAFGECGIDTQCVAGQADLTKLNESKVPRFW